jgi:indolepyruvate ferredoxin oxidoreductase, beta subunit
MSEPVTSVVFAGLGGQGVLKASDILAEVAFRAGLDVKKSELHGMSQRGGSVSSDVRYGERVYSPMVPPGEADYLVVFEETQVPVARGAVRADGVMIEPSLVPKASLPNAKALNVALLGALSTYLQFPKEAWLEAVRKNLPEKLHEMNEQAFEIGIAAAQEQLKAAK